MNDSASILSRGGSTPTDEPPAPRVVHALERTSRVSAYLCIVVAFMVLAGWLFDIEFLKRIATGLTAMNPMTAVGFILSGASLRFMSARGSTAIQKGVARLLAALVILIGIIKLMTIAHGPDLGIDRLLFPERIFRGETRGNPMALMTALCFVCNGGALLTLDTVKLRRFQPSQALALVCITMALLAVVGYTYNASKLFGQQWYFPMALHTALTFIVLSAGILFCRPTVGLMRFVTLEGPTGALARRMLPAALLIPALLGWIRLIIERHGILERDMGRPLLVLANTVCFTALVWFNLALLSRADARRRKIEEERDRFFTLSRDLVAVAGFDGYFKRVNGAFETTLGYTPSEMTSRAWLDFVHPDDIARTIAEGQKLSAGAVTLHFENRYLCKDGSYKWIAWTSVPVVKEQKIYAIARDMTERKHAQQELEAKNVQLQAAARAERDAREALQATQGQLVQSEKMAGLGQMVAGVAHEINNPLSFVSNNVAVLQRDLAVLKRLIELYQKTENAAPDTRALLLGEIHDIADKIDLPYTLGNIGELLNRSRDGLKRIQQIVRDLRDFARLDQADLQDADLNAGIDSTINIIQGYARKHQVQIETHFAPLPPVRCHAAKLNQVVMNLVVNAIDASPAGKTVIIRTAPGAGGGVKIEVIDSGKGIDPAIRDRIFDPFFTTKPPGEGTGLGLSISYGIVQEHGGRIEVISEVGKGSTFAVELPVMPEINPTRTLATVART